MRTPVGRVHARVRSHPSPGHSSAPAWTPAQLPGQVMRLRGDLGITLTTSKLSAWGDQSGSGNSVTQATGANEPTYTLTANGHPLPTFGSNLVMTLASKITMATGLTYAIIYRTVSSASIVSTSRDLANTLIGDSTGGAYSQFGVDGGFTTFSAYDTVNSTWTFTKGTVPVNDGNPHLSIVTYATGAGAIALYTDGAADGTSTHGAYQTAFEGFNQIGKGNLSHYFAGDVAEIVVCNGVLSATNLGLIHTYSQGFWGSP